MKDERGRGTRVVSLYGFIPPPSSLSLQRLRALDVDRREVVVEVQEDRQRDRRLGGGEDDDEHREDLAVEGRMSAQAGAVRVAVERDEVDVGGVQDQFYAHQDADRVP